VLNEKVLSWKRGHLDRCRIKAKKAAFTIWGVKL